MSKNGDRWCFSVPSKSVSIGQIFTCISIWSVLAYVIIPTFNGRYDRPTQASCMSNMKQLGLALIGYTEDYDGKFPSGSIVLRKKLLLPSDSAAKEMPAKHAGRSHGLGVGWAGGAEPYIKSTGIFHCPDDKSKPLSNRDGSSLYPISYAMNQWVGGQSQNDMVSLATTVLLFECTGGLVNMTTAREGGSEIHSPIGDGASDPQTGVPDFGDAFNTATGVHGLTINNRGDFARHDVGGAGGGGSLWLLGDGHVKFLRFNDVSVGKQPVSQGYLGDKFKASFNPVD